MVVLTCSRSIQEAEAGGWLWIWGQTGLHSNFQANQEYLARSYLNKLKSGTGEMVWLRALSPLSEDPGSSPGTHMKAHNCLQLQF